MGIDQLNLNHSLHLVSERELTTDQEIALYQAFALVRIAQGIERITDTLELIEPRIHSPR